MAPYTAASAEATKVWSREEWLEHLRGIVDNGAMVANGMEDGLEWVCTRTYPAKTVRQAYAHRLVELNRYRQGFATGAFFGWLAEGPRGASHDETEAVRCVGDVIQLFDRQSGHRMDVVVASMECRAAARVLRSVAAELRRAPETRIDIVVRPDHLTLALADQLRLELWSRHPCPRTAAHLLRRCLGATSAGLRIRIDD